MIYKIQHYLLATLVFFLSIGFIQGQIATDFTKLEPSTRSAQALFGESVATFQDMILVGAPFEISEDENGETLNRAGAVYCYKKSDNGDWNQVQKIFPALRDDMDNFGYDIAINGNLMVVSAPRITTGNKNGQVYTFSFDGENWIEQEILIGPDTDPYDSFGAEVAVSDNFILVGSPRHDFDAQGLNKDNVGAVYKYAKSNDSWTFVNKISASDARAGDEFGTSLSIANQKAFIGAPHKVIEVNENSGGAVYIVDLNTSQEEHILTSPNPVNNGFFGRDIAAFGNMLAIGSKGDPYNEQDIDFNPESGSVYIFNKVGNDWIKSQKVCAANRMPFDNFGFSVAINGNRLLVGATQENALGFAALFTLGEDNIWYQTDQISNSFGNSDDLFGNAVALNENVAIVGANHDDHDSFENNFRSNAGAAFAFQHNSTELVLGEIPNQLLCNEDTVRIPFQLFNTGAGNVSYDLQSSNSNAIPNNSDHLYIEGGEHIVLKPRLRSDYDNTEIQIGVVQNQMITETTFEVEIYRPFTNWTTEEICFGDSIFIGGAYRKENNSVYCDTIDRGNGCYNLDCTNLIVKDSIDTSITVAPSNTATSNTATYESYRWIDCETGETAIGLNGLPSYSALIDGWYAVDITTNNCTTRSNCHFLSSQPVSLLEAQQKEHVNVAINRKLKSFQIIGISPGSEIIVFNALGQTIHHQSISSDDKIRYETWSSGIYIASIRDKNTSHAIRISL